MREVEETDAEALLVLHRALDSGDGVGVILVPLDMWLERLELDGQRNPKRVEGRFEFVDVTGEAASAKLQIYEDGEHLYTDYFGLYKMPDGWKIVSKSFQSHP